MKPMKVLLTGSTGFLGEYLLAELLERGHSVWALYRSESRKLDTIQYLNRVGLPRSSDSLHWVKGEVLEADKQWDNWRRNCDGLDEVDTLLHNAASTRLHMDASGEPLRTNLEGARAFRRLVDRHPMNAHLISTAYVCGFVQGRLIEEVNHPRGDFVNVYEESKWEAEQIWVGDATILRPSIIVGDSETGRCTAFGGWYILFQAAYLLDRLMNNTDDPDRLHLGINIPADASGAMNIITVDSLAKSVVRITENPANHKKIFHLSHPYPPTHQWTLNFICNRFNVGGFKLAGIGSPFTQPRNRIEQMVWRQMQAILSHFSNNPLFDRTNTDAAVPDLKPVPITEVLVNRLLDYAIACDWGHARR